MTNASAETRAGARGNDVVNKTATCDEVIRAVDQALDAAAHSTDTLANAVTAEAPAHPPAPHHRDASPGAAAPPPAPPATGSVLPGPSIQLGKAALDAGNSCVQCGLCLPSCPTYLETGNEADSPRGRIRLMLGLHDGEVPHTDAAQTHLDRCLDCRACETACPSGVQYHRLIENARHELAEDEQPLTLLQRAIFYGVFTKPKRLRAAVAGARLADKLRIRKLARALRLPSLMGPTIEKMDRLLPIETKGPLFAKRLPEHSRAGGMDLIVKQLSPTKADPNAAGGPVAFFEGCVAGVLASELHHKALDLLCAAGVDVVSPKQQQCCGAIHHHSGDPDTAQDMARDNIDAYLPVHLDRDQWPRFITTCTAGDGAMLRQYGELLADDPEYAVRAAEFADRVRDITEVLLELNVGVDTPRLLHPVAMSAAYHDACHLAHAQRVTSAPRQLLSRVEELKLIDLPESDVCCGAAGTYNLQQPEMAQKLAIRKLDHFAETRADVLVSGNIGCTMHLRAAADLLGLKVTIVHPVDLLHTAAFGRGASVRRS